MGSWPNLPLQITADHCQEKNKFIFHIGNVKVNHCTNSMLTEKRENGSLQLYRHNHEIVGSVIAQLEKDVLLCGGAISISSNSFNDIEVLKSELQNYISTISITNPGLFFNLLYRVDISSKLIETEDISTLILKRELAKVLIRRSYKV